MIVVAFYVLVVMFTTPHADIYRSHPEIFKTHEQALRFECGAVMGCTRVGGHAIGYVIDGAVFAFDSIFKAPQKFYTGQTKSPAELEEFLHAMSLRAQEKKDALNFIAKFLFRIVIFSLLPVLFILNVPRTVYSLVLLLLFGICLAGYGALRPFFAENLLFAIRGDQIGMYEFMMMTQIRVHDLAEVGFLASLIVVMMTGKANDLRVAAGMAAIGQTFYEHLGLLTGISLSLYIFFTSTGGWKERLRGSFRILLACGIAAICIHLIFVGIILIKHETLYFVFRYGFDEIFKNAAPNLENYRYLLFRLGYFIFVPAALGAAVGSICAVVDPALRKFYAERGMAIAAVFFVLVGFFFAAAIGMATYVNMHAELGRQFLSAAVFSLVLAFFGSAWCAGVLAGRKSLN